VKKLDQTLVDFAQSRKSERADNAQIVSELMEKGVPFLAAQSIVSHCKLLPASQKAMM
jgi:hypothetical protein